MIMYKRISRAQVGVVLLLCLSTYLSAANLVLFDEGHAQTAGNADWVIGGGFSDFADVFKKMGCEVKSITKMTKQDLANAVVLVLPEPNSYYTPEEEKVIVDYVNNGGGIFVISDHNNSDRNGDGVDSVGVFNRFLPKLGMEIEKKYFSEAPVSGEYINSPITKDVKAVGTWGGTSVKCLSASGIAHIKVSAKNGGGAYIATLELPSGGKVIAMGDSSPFDDGTGNPKDKLHDGFNNPKCNHDALARNSAQWLLSKKRSLAGNAYYSFLKSDYLLLSEAEKIASSLPPSYDASDLNKVNNLNDTTGMKDYLAELETKMLNMIDSDPSIAEKIRLDFAEKSDSAALLKRVQAKLNFSSIHNLR
ncbi:MAG: hypothetical protein HQM10_26145 [Candidatus Riflebacteria bacterium]|nr:hypothetical protein [Candidatus Riflebacteria bacterium]